MNCASLPAIMAPTLFSSTRTHCAVTSSGTAAPPLASVTDAGPHRIDALIDAGDLEAALAALEALPPSTPELSRLMGRLFIAMAEQNKHDELARLVPPMLARCMPHPEITRALMALAAFSPHPHMREILSSMDCAVANLYGVSQTALGELIRRMAHSYRRTGEQEAASRLLDTWHHCWAA